MTVTDSSIADLGPRVWVESMPSCAWLHACSPSRIERAQRRRDEWILASQHLLAAAGPPVAAPISLRRVAVGLSSPDPRRFRSGVTHLGDDHRAHGLSSDHQVPADNGAFGPRAAAIGRRTR
jgi:hypothetical protein